MKYREDQIQEILKEMNFKKSAIKEILNNLSDKFQSKNDKGQKQCYWCDGSGYREVEHGSDMCPDCKGTGIDRNKVKQK